MIDVYQYRYRDSSSNRLMIVQDLMGFERTYPFIDTYDLHKAISMFSIDHHQMVDKLRDADSIAESRAWDEYTKGGPSYRMVTPATLELVHYIKTPRFLMTDQIPLSIKPREFKGKLVDKNWRGYEETGLNLLLDGSRGEPAEDPAKVLTMFKDGSRPIPFRDQAAIDANRRLALD